MERVLFALVDHRVSDDACDRAIDGLIAVEAELTRGVFDAVAHLHNLEVELVVFDTTSTYFETEQADEPVWRDDRTSTRCNCDHGPAGP